MPETRIILPAHTTVTVGDTLWWGVEGEIVPPEWQALTEACATCGGYGQGDDPWWDCPDCHEGRRTVEVVRSNRPGTKPASEASDYDGQALLGRAVIDGDWVPIVDWHGIWKRPAPCVERIGPNFHAFWSSTEQQQGQPITLHGHTDPGGYAARFEVIA